MLRRIGVTGAICAAVMGTPSAASAQQTVNFTFGYFTPIGEDARDRDDVLLANRRFLVFDIGDFRGATGGAEWLVSFGEFLEGGAGIRFSRRTVASVYEDFVDSDGTEIDQDLRLRLVPIDFTVRVLPLGQSLAVQPYVGGGVSIVNWRYSEVGEFVEFPSLVIFRDRFVDSGSVAAPVIVGGVRVGGTRFYAGGEIRWHGGTADLDEHLFAADRLDVGGWAYQATVGIRFGR